MPRTDAPPSLAVIAVTRNGADLALRLQAAMPGVEIHVPPRHRFALAMGAKPYGHLADVVPELWERHRALVFIMAAGIVVRLIAPLMAGKRHDPAVVVLDERGNHVISLLSGHLGGANALAERIAAITGGRAVITTASDVAGKPALDLLADGAALVAENPAAFARLSRALLEGEPLWISDPTGSFAGALNDEPAVTFLAETESVPARGPGILVTDRADATSAPALLLLRPRRLVVGVGCNRGTGAAEILALLRSTLAGAGLSPLAVRNLASITLKSDEPGLLEAAHTLGRPIVFLPPEELSGVAVPNPSETVLTHVGVKSVCEAAALASAKTRELLVTKQKSTNATAAVARAASTS